MMKKKALILLLALAMSVSLAACGGNSGSSGSSAAETPAADSADAVAEEGGAGGEVQGLEAAIAEAPVLLTSVGQSADADMVKALMERIDMEPALEKLATEDDLDGINTLILAVGGSSKGLGAAGIDENQELDRVKKLIDAASDKGVTIIAMHIGGEARRGELSDKFIGPSFEKADYAIVVADGDKDGLMAGLASQYGIPMDVVTTMADATAPMQAAFK